MKLYLESGEEFAWQWDLNHRLILEGVDPGMEVHYSNFDSEEALVLEAYSDGEHVLSNVPNVLLQEAKDISVYIFSGQTKFSGFICVNPRTKPSDYVYTETEVKRYETLEKRIEALEKNGLPALGAEFEGCLFFCGPGGALEPLVPGNTLRIAMDASGRYVLDVVGGAAPDEPDIEIPVTVTMGDDGTILMTPIDLVLDSTGTIIASAAVTLDDDGAIIIGGDLNG